MTADAAPTNAPPCILNFRSPLLLSRRTATHAFPDQPILNSLKSLELQDHMFLINIYFSSLKHSFSCVGPCRPSL